MKKAAIGLLCLFGIFTFAMAQDWDHLGHATYDPTDDTANWYGNPGSRGLTAGSDLDGDGKQEIFAAHYGNGGGVVGFEFTSEGELELVWDSSDLDTTTYSSGTRIVQTGDIDGDGFGEIVFFRGRYSSDPARGLYIYEWDGTDNGYQFAFHSTLFTLSGDTISELRVEYFVIDDVDQDGDEEIIFASNGPSWGANRSEDMFSVLTIDGDIGSGFESVSEEYYVSARELDLGGGSAINVAISDIDDDGLKEIYCHAWNSHNNFFVEATGADTYDLGDTTYQQITAGLGDHVSLMNAAVADIDGLAGDEVYASNYYTGDVYLIYDNNGDATNFDSTEVIALGVIGSAYGTFGGAAYDFDGDGDAEIYFGGTGDADILSVYGDNALTDSTAGGFVSKMAPCDLDGDGNWELATAHQSVPDSIEVIENGDTTMVANDHYWVVRSTEYVGGAWIDQEYTVITPEDYKLSQAYPNPFNPTTNIEYSLPVSNTISLVIYNTLGQEVVRLVDNVRQEAGDYTSTWDAKDRFGNPVTNGVYIYKLSFGNFSKSRTVTLLK